MNGCTHIRAGLVAAALALMQGVAVAQEAADPYEPFRSPSDSGSSGNFRFDDSHIKPWEEDKAVDIPVLSEPGLKALEIDHGPPGLRYWIDMDTLSVGKDNVVRYWLVTESGGRRTNVLYEGINCAEGSYKTYAYASPRRLSLVRPVRSPRWEHARGLSVNDYHNELMSTYFCWKGSPRSLAGMSGAVRGVDNIHTGQAEDTDFIRP